MSERLNEPLLGGEVRRSGNSIQCCESKVCGCIVVATQIVGLVLIVYERRGIDRLKEFRSSADDDICTEQVNSSTLVETYNEA